MTPDDPIFDSDPDAPPSEEEARAADDLRLALADPDKQNADAELARALHLAHEPRAIDADEHRALVDRSLGARTHRTQRTPEEEKASGGRLIRVAFGVAAAVSLAAGIAFVIGRGGLDPAPERTAAVASPPLVHVRSTQPLFAEPFATKGGASARIDRIAMARASDLRDNQFARWGVR
jgi:hypothetical protein